MEWSISGYYIRCCCIKWKDQIDNNLFTSEGDGRMDSPGHCAQFCSYTFMEYETKKILSIVTMDKRMTDKKSTVLEKACFLKGLRIACQKTESGGGCYWCSPINRITDELVFSEY